MSNRNKSFFSLNKILLLLEKIIRNKSYSSLIIVQWLEKVGSAAESDIQL